MSNASTSTNEPMLDPVYQALVRDDPTAGLVTYVKEIKPFHTKILDIFVEYVFEEKVNITVYDSSCSDIVVDTSMDGVSVERQCGYGILWDPVSPLTRLPIKEAGGHSHIADDEAYDRNSFLVERPTIVKFPIQCTDPVRGLFKFEDLQLEIIEHTSTTITLTGNVTHVFGRKQVVKLVGDVSIDATVSDASYDYNRKKTIVTVTSAPTNAATVKISAPLVWPYTEAMFPTDASLPTILTTRQAYYIVPTETARVFRLSTQKNGQVSNIVNNLPLAVGWMSSLVVSDQPPPGFSMSVDGSVNSTNDYISCAIKRTTKTSQTISINGAIVPLRTGDVFRVINNSANEGWYQVIGTSVNHINKVTNLKVAQPVATTAGEGLAVLDYSYNVYRSDIIDETTMRIQVMQDIPRETKSLPVLPIFDGMMYYTQYGGYDAPSVCFPSTSPDGHAEGYVSERLEIIIDGDSANTITIMTQKRPVI